jgi:hypothetical protein
MGYPRSHPYCFADSNQPAVHQHQRHRADRRSSRICRSQYRNRDNTLTLPHNIKSSAIVHCETARSGCYSPGSDRSGDSISFGEFLVSTHDVPSYERKYCFTEMVKLDVKSIHHHSSRINCFNNHKSFRKCGTWSPDMTPVELLRTSPESNVPEAASTLHEVTTPPEYEGMIDDIPNDICKGA